MTTSYRVVDSKGFLARPYWMGVAEVSEIQTIREHLEQGLLDGTTKPKDRELAWKVLEALEKLPQRPALQVINAWDLKYGNAVSAKLAHEDVLYVIGAVDKFSTSSGNLPKFHPSERVQEWGLEDVELMLAGAAAWNRVVGQVFPSYKLPSATLKQGKVLWDKLQQGEAHIKVNDPLRDMVQVDSYAVYIGGTQPGFLDGRGGISPLAGARMFESQASAKTTIRSRGLHDAVVVKLKATLVEVCPEQTTTGNLDDLMTAIAHIEKQEILQALDLADDGALREALEKREQPKRRM